MISLIAAIGKNNEIGKGNTLLFNMPADMKHFRDTTRGHAVIMGRKTFESLPNGALPNRRNIIITRDKEYNAEGIEIVYSLDEAIEKIKDENESFIIGGAEIYKQSINKADKLYITEINSEFGGADTFFPIIDKEIWKETKREDFQANPQNPFDYSFIEYERK